jgi:hypothetical protein
LGSLWARSPTITSLRISIVVAESQWCCWYYQNHPYGALVHGTWTLPTCNGEFLGLCIVVW